QTVVVGDRAETHLCAGGLDRRSRGIRPGEADHVVARGDEFRGDGRADPARSTCDENTHENNLPMTPSRRVRECTMSVTDINHTPDVSRCHPVASAYGSMATGCARAPAARCARAVPRARVRTDDRLPNCRARRA